MSVTVARSLGTQQVKLTFDSDSDATRFADAALSALRDAQIKLTHALKLSADAYVVLGQGGAKALNPEFLELVR